MRDSIKRIAQQFIVSHYPESEIVWIGGSAVYGNLTTESDIDLIIIDETETPRLECYHFLGWKIEAFIYTALSLEFEFQTARYRGMPTIIKMCAEGLLIEDKQGNGEEFQREARILYEQGPQLWDEDKINEARYKITDFLSDFRSSEDFEESLFILNKLIDTLTELILRADGNWVGVGKWVARNLKSYDIDMCDKLVKYTRKYMITKDKTELISFIQSTLDNYGGELFVGYKEFFL
ncbi:nucleotidyltransferase domain-containing protein [Schinkia azotoformans]|uniref:nucleotidyltransferase domain-containing protein n=1 Tax=Schinkia azotoformans TaxID=1454 RepID=UPI002DBD9BD1|nr:nucleotidyltransferase domain-containing protein [Schinkia azotoformans]MEC1716670.1 nucleotidyltransferase domain-containing protein [Schinkia azotoformans]MEC1746230.1 nucleotidyltransferase domain-containing protein [Schinkia azotoformans]MEC1756484.1 nucleotidyltransferase domain-containing protein [Schinkia azotoformans]